jgi:AraC-like DNA-binding protein
VGILELIRASVLQGFAQCVGELGGDPEALLSGAAITPERICDRDAYIPSRTHAGLLTRAAEELCCPDFALRLSDYRGIEVLGPVALAGRHATTVQDGFDALARYIHVFNTTSHITVAPLRAGEVRFTHSMLDDSAATAQRNELALATSVQGARALIGEHFRPLRVFLPHAPVSSPASYRQFFGSEVAFGHAHCGFDFLSEDLARPIRASDPLVRDVATQYLESPANASRRVAPETALRAIITQSLAAGHCTLLEVARELFVHPRTLQRHLAAQGLRFEHVVADVRRDRARHYLENTTMPLSDVSDLLGYSDQSSLTRACRAWFGACPRSVRNDRQARPPAFAPLSRSSWCSPTTPPRSTPRPTAESFAYSP